MTPLQKAGYLAHSLTAPHQRAVQDAQAMLTKHSDYALMCSWGKDSLCILHMALQVMDRVTVIHARYSPYEELPDIPQVRDAMLAQYGERIDYHELPTWGDWEIYQRAGRFFLRPESAAERTILREWEGQIKCMGEELIRALGKSGKALGLSAHESRARAITVAKRGRHYQTAAESMPKILPIAYWRSQDVLAYMVAHDLPMLRIYQEAQDPERARSEVAFATIGAEAADAVRRHGAWQEWARVYPELWAAWVAQWPQIRQAM